MRLLHNSANFVDLGKEKLIPMREPDLAYSWQVLPAGASRHQFAL